MKTPLNSWDKSKSSEVMDYVLEELIPAIDALDGKKANLSDISDLKQMVNIMEGKLSNQSQISDLELSINILDGKMVDQSEISGLKQSINVLAAHVDEINDRISTLISSIDIMAVGAEVDAKIKDINTTISLIDIKQGKIIDSILALSSKLDAEDVQSLDTNYNSTIVASLS